MKLIICDFENILAPAFQFNSVSNLFRQKFTNLIFRVEEIAVDTLLSHAVSQNTVFTLIEEQPSV